MSESLCTCPNRDTLVGNCPVHGTRPTTQEPNEWLVLRRLKLADTNPNESWVVIGKFLGHGGTTAVDSAARHEHEHMNFDTGETQEYAAIPWHLVEKFSAHARLLVDLKPTDRAEPGDA